MKSAAAEKVKPEEAAKLESITITPPNFQTIKLAVKGTAPLLQLRFGAKAEMLARHQEGGPARSKKNRAAKDIQALFKNALHVSSEGWYGIPCAAFRNAAISACRIVGYKMTLAKMAIFVEADGYEKDDETPLVRITKGEPVLHSGHVRNATGVIDIRIRAIFKEWSCAPRVRYDADLFKTADIVNLLYRAGQQVGVGEGRPDSRESCGMGFGLFVVGLGEVMK
jgi:hypothetical protein